MRDPGDRTACFEGLVKQHYPPQMSCFAMLGSEKL